MSVYKLFAAGSGGTENGLAQIDVQFDGIITALYGDLSATLSANGDDVYSELSFTSQNTRTSNDSRGTLMSLDLELLFAGAAYASNISKNGAVGGLAIAVNAGERLWMHVVATASRVSRCVYFVYVEDGQGAPVSRVRR